MRYEEVQPASLDDIREALRRAEYEAAARFLIGAALHAQSPELMERLFIEASASAHELVRGSAVLALGHLARRFGRLDRSAVEPCIRAALTDPEPFVRSQAHSAAEDIEQFAGWSVRA